MDFYVIIGGGGFLGAHIISALQRNGFRNRIIVIDPKPHYFRTIKYDRKQVTCIRKSFLDPQLLDEVLPGASAVFHLAAMGHIGMSAGDKKLVYNFNVLGTKLLVEKCKEYNVKRFLYASSVAVCFVGEPLYNINESDPLPEPGKYLDHYSASKAEAEKYVISQSTPKFKTVCLRFRAIYGPEDPNVTHKVANLIRNGLFIGMVSVHGRESISNASSVVNCAKAFVLSDRMLQKANGIHGRAYFIMDGENTGQYCFWLPLVLALGRKPPSLQIPYEFMKTITPYFEQFCYGFLKVPPLLTKFELSILATDNTYSIERARQELGYEPEPSLMPEVAKYYEQLEQLHLATASMIEWRILIGFIICFSFLLCVFLSI